MKQPPDAREGLFAPSKDWPILLPLVVTLVLSLLIRLFDVDRKISELSYDAARNYWPFERSDPWLSFYRYGVYPPLILGAVGLIVFLFGRWILPMKDSLRLNEVRRSGLFLALMLAIGPGLLVNGGLKSLWGRPRPLQCKEFGGDMVFRPIGEIATHKFPNSSFPSGHAAVAFFLMAPGFVISSHRPRLRWGWFLGGVGYGLAMGFTRILQGGHFVSDVLWAGIIVYFVGVGLVSLMFRHQADEGPVDDFPNRHDSISMASTS